MDGPAFDELSRAMARGLPRRQVLARLGTGGLGAALFGAVGIDRARSARPAAQTATCQLDLIAAVRVGPNAEADLGGDEPGELRGELSFGLDDEGAITAGQFRFEDGTELSVVGQAVGRAVHLRAQVGEDSAVVLVGTAAQDLVRCQGAVDGLLTGPAFGDLGDWHATASALRRQSGGSSSGGSSSGGGTGQSPPRRATAAPRATTEPDECPDGEERCGDECVDLRNDSRHCGECDNACDGDTETCIEGSCSECLEGETDCDGYCTYLPVDPNNCGECGNVCAEDQACEGGVCLCLEGTTACDGVCVDTSTDDANCGECGNDCLDVFGVCVEGTCVDACEADGLTNCNPDEPGSGFCVDLQTDPQFCGSCDTACAEGEGCQNGACVDACTAQGLTNCGDYCADFQVDPTNCGGCGIFCDNGTGICDDGVCAPSGCTVACAPGLTPCIGDQVCDCCDPGEACNNGVCA